MKANYEDKIPQKTSEVNLGNLYDINKQIMLQTDAMPKEKQIEHMNAIAEWFQYGHPTERYYMLLCHERRDYTLFNLDKSGQWRNMPGQNCAIAAADVLECMTNRGDLLSIELQENGAYELWLRADDDCFAYYLFPYSTAVLEY